MEINFVTKEVRVEPPTDAEVKAQVAILIAFIGLTAYTIKKMSEPFDHEPRLRTKRSLFR